MLWLILLLVQSAASSCPWLCLCYLQDIPITANCSATALSSFPLDIDTRVQWIDLKDNIISTIPNLSGYTELEVLELSGNRINKIFTTAFRKLYKLKYLDLSNNSFTDWSSVNARTLLQSTVKLKTLKLSHNSLKHFDGKDGPLYIRSSSLEELHLRSCDIATVDGDALTGLTKLQLLDLSHNHIKWLNDLSSKTLNYLDLSFCELDSMSPFALSKLPALTTLKLTGNSQFAINFGNLTSGSLQTYEAAYCSLTSPGLYSLPNLTYANLRGNKIEVLKERTFIKNKVLVELDLSSNEIKEIHPQAFVAARQIAFVNLSSNSLKGPIPWNTFSTNYNLKVLDLSRNRLENVGNLSIIGLEHLDLSECLIKEIQKDSLTSLPWLRTLNLSYNPLQSLPDDTQSWLLRNLDLSYCRLSSISNETFRRFPDIETINLTGNRFTNPFKTYMFEYNERLESLRLEDNPWICDCNARDFKSFWEFLNRMKQSEQTKELKCMSPDPYAGKTWLSACYEVWYPYDEPQTGFGLTHYGSVIVMVIIMMAGIFAVVGAIKHGIKRRMKQEQEEVEREISRRFVEDESRVVYQRRVSYGYEDVDDTQVRTPRPPVRERSESQLTQPPTYEEAVQMLSASRENVLSQETAAAGASGTNHGDSEDEQAGSYSIGSELSDDEHESNK